MKNKFTEETTLEIEEVTETTLRLLGLNGTYKGFGYLIYGVRLAITVPDILTAIYKEFYMEVAREFGTTPECVERNIRTAKKIIWKYGKEMLRDEIFGERYQGDNLPDNKDFVDALKCYIERQVRKNRWQTE